MCQHNEPQKPHKQTLFRAFFSLLPLSKDDGEVRTLGSQNRRVTFRYQQALPWPWITCLSGLLRTVKSRFSSLFRTESGKRRNHFTTANK